jgi:putative ABC transport system permease protein
MKHALRHLAKSPGFSAVAVLTLALGIGANTAIFSVVEAALLRPLPFPEPDRVVRLYEAFDDPDGRANTLNLSEITVRDWREQSRDIFTAIGVATGASLTFGRTEAASAHNISAARVSANFFSALGLPPVLGRNFTAAEDRPGGPRVVIVSDDFWRRALGGRASALGQTITLDNAPYTVVGVMPKNFRHPYRADLWIPLAAAFDPIVSRGHYLYAAARLQPGFTVAQADAAMRRVCASINSAKPDPNNPRRAFIRPLREGFVADLRPKLIVISAAALCALFIAAANFAGLLLARAVDRESDTAVRAALGATRGRLMRETLTHTVVLATLGTAVGLLFATWLTPALVALSPEGSDATGSALREFDYAVRLDWPVFAFATCALLFVGVLFGLLPARRAARTDFRTALNASSRGATLDRDTHRLLGGLVVAEIAFAVVLLVSSFMFTQHFSRLVREPWGFATGHRLTFNAMLSTRLYPDAAARVRAAERTVAELRALPGVRSATAMLPHPMNAPRELFITNIEGRPAPEPRGFYLAYLRGSLPGQFTTLGQSLLRGRDFNDTDRATSTSVCIVSDSFARRFWPEKNPLGRRVKWGRLDSPRPWLTVVGVMADTKAIADPDDGEIVGTVALPLAQLLATANAFDEFTFIVETASDPRSLESAARAALARVDLRLAAYEFKSLETAAAESRATERFALTLISLFGVLGLILSGIGLYGLLRLQVARRTREFGIRSALGATAAEIVRLVATHGARLLALGIFFGAIATWFAARLAQTRWPDLPNASPFAWIAAVSVLALATALACWLPARRAARVDPIVALRAE